MLHKATITSIERHVSSPSLVSSRAALRASLKGLTLLSQQSTSTGSTLKATFAASRSLLSSCLEDYDTAVSCALTYCALKPDDSLGPTLLSAAVLGATSQGVLHSLASLGLSQCTHLLLHPLSCTSCFQPMNVPVASTALGLMTCAACFAGSPRDSEGGPHKGGGEEQKSSATAALLELSLDPRWAAAVEERLKGNTALARKDLEGAVEAFTLATTPTPSHFTAWSNLSHVLLEQGKVFDSLGAADAAVAHSPPFYAKGEWRRCRAMAALGWKGSAFGALLKFVARGTLAGAASVHRLAWALTLKGDVDEVEEGELGEEEEEEEEGEEEGEGVKKEGVKKEGESAPPTAASAGAAAAVAEEEEEELAPPPPLQDHEALELLGWCREHAHRVLCATVLKDGGAHTLPRKARSLVTLPRYQSFSIRSALGRTIFEDLATLCTEYFQQVREEEEKEREKQQQQQQEGSLTLPPAPPFPPTQAVLKAVEEAIASVVQRVTPLAPAAIEEKARLVSMGWWGGCGEESIPSIATSPPTTTTSSTASETDAVAIAPAAAAVAVVPAPAAAAAAGGGAAPEVVTGEERWSMGDATPQPPYLPASIPASKEALCCYVCFDIQYEPVALPECGHSLCRPCLQRVLDHKPQCPVCRSNASSLLATQSYNTAIVQGVLRLVLAIAPGDASTRREGCAEERSSSTHTLPVFVCSLALPHSPTPLHIFEPRYRLMVRRCVQDRSRRFGMVPHDPTAPGGYPSVGVSLFVRRVRLLPDGRSYVNCLAEGQERRFRVLERGMSEGGYSMCKVEWLKDSDSGRELEGLGWEGGLPPPSSQGDTSLSSSTDAAASFQFLKTYVEGILHASRAKTLVEVEALLRSDGFENEEGAEALSPSLLMAAAQGCRVIANVLEDGLPPVPPLTPATAQEWLWWVAGALPCSDRLKYQWLSALSWGRRMELVSSFVQDSTIASPATFALRVGAIAGSGQHCGIQ